MKNFLKRWIAFISATLLMGQFALAVQSDECKSCLKLCDLAGRESTQQQCIKGCDDRCKE